MQVIGITSGKGGVGKTNLTVNLGIALSRLGQRVLIIDADLGLANVDILLDETPRATLEHLLLGNHSLDDVLIESKHGVTILPGASGVMEMANLDASQRMRLMSAVEVLEDAFDAVIVDTGAGIGTNAAFFASAVQEVLVIATPEPTSLTDAYAMIKVLNRTYGVNRVGLVLNQVESASEAQDVYLRLDSLTSRFLNVVLELMCWLPLDPTVRHAVMQQQPMVAQFPNAPYSVAVSRLGQKMTMRPRPREGGRMQFFWNKIVTSPQAQPGS
jgi:flagellar biosynthesis protein FlhG